MFKTLRFTREEVEKIIRDGNLTDREVTILELRNKKDNLPSIEECAEIMNVSVSTVTRTIRDLKDKILRIL